MTNPSESSFRTFLTEQAFRHHLSSLDDAEADAQDELEAASAVMAPHSAEMLVRKGGLSGSFSKYRSPLSSYASPPFAFANRASVSLRTPKHMFRSFGIFSVAAVVPASNLSSSSRSSRVDRAQQSQQQGDDESTTCDRQSHTQSLLWESWFVGAFGMWFWAVNLDGLWRESGLVTRDETDGTVTGVLEVKALDRSDSPNRACRQGFFSPSCSLFFLLMLDALFLPQALRTQRLAMVMRATRNEQRLNCAPESASRLRVALHAIIEVRLRRRCPKPSLYLCTRKGVHRLPHQINQLHL